MSSNSGLKTISRSSWKHKWSIWWVEFFPILISRISINSSSNSFPSATNRIIGAGDRSFHVLDQCCDVLTHFFFPFRVLLLLYCVLLMNASMISRSVQAYLQFLVSLGDSSLESDSRYQRRTWARSLEQLFILHFGKWRHRCLEYYVISSV